MDQDLFVLIIEKYGWVFFMAGLLMNVFYIKFFKIKQLIKENPSLKDGYNKIINAFGLWASLPWLLVGIFILTGKMDSIFSLFEVNCI